MGLFDIFSSSDAQNAAQAQIAGLNAAYQQGANWLEQGTTAASNAYGQGQGSLVNNANQAAGALNQNYAAGLQPFQQNYSQAQQGTNQLASLLGFGPQGSAGIQSTLQNLPGYQFALNQGSQNVMRNQAATGALNSGATQADLQQLGQGLASQNYNNYVSQLQPFLGAAGNAASGIGNMYSGLGNQLGNTYNALGQNLNANQMGFGNLVNQNQNTGAAMAYGTQAGIGNAAAQADYANLAQSGALFGGLMNLGGSALKAFGGR